jgi:ABC-type bacteriocin/lantibiotic exporter with double-glycine peptidase domain
MKKGKPKSKPRLFKQEKIYACAVACLRMILDYLDFEIDEPSLSVLCRTDANGTSADDLVHAANQLGFHARKEYSSIKDVQKYLSEGIFPILYVNLLAIDGLAITHAFVLEVVTQGSVTVLDPWRGRRKIASHPFKIAWEKTRNLAVLVYER